MSATIMAEVARHSQARGSMQCVLLRLAFYADPEGKNAFPSLQTLTITTGYDEKTIQTCIQKLENAGHITVDRQKVPGRRPRNVYTVCRPWRIGQNVSTAQTITGVVPEVQEVPAQMITGMCTNDHGSDSCGSYNPSYNPKEREKTHAHAPEERAKRERLLEILGCPAGSDAWDACMNGYLAQGVDPPDEFDTRSESE